MRNRRKGLRARPHLDQLDDRCLLSGYSPVSSTGLTPAQLTIAYGLNAITFTSSSGTTVKGDGSGETIALIEAYDDPNLASDLKTFDQAYNLPAANLTVVDQAGSQTNSGWAGEESLDVEWCTRGRPRGEYPGRRGQVAKPPGPVERREHGAEHGRGQCGLDELGVLRDAQ